VSRVRFCRGCNAQLRPEWCDGGTLCLSCRVRRADVKPADPGNRVTLWFVLAVLGGCVVAWWVAKILKGAG
jgi:hypothetical protein